MTGTVGPAAVVATLAWLATIPWWLVGATRLRTVLGARAVEGRRDGHEDDEHDAAGRSAVRHGVAGLVISGRHDGDVGPPWRRRRPPHPQVDAVLLLDLVASALATGVPLPRALAAVGAVIPGEQGVALGRVSSALVMGAPWQSAWLGTPDSTADLADVLERSWVSGAAPGPSLVARAAQLRRERRARVRTAAAALGVHLLLPLGACFLPAFVLLGLVPLVLSLARGLFA